MSRLREAYARSEVFYDREGQTLTVWFDDPKTEVIVDVAFKASS